MGKLEKLHKIYAYVRDRYASTGQGIWLSASLKAISKTERVCCRYQLAACSYANQQVLKHPVILSTRSHGIRMCFTVDKQVYYVTGAALLR